MNRAQRIGGAIGLTFILAVIILGMYFSPARDNKTSFHKIIEIEGMTCIEYNNGLTCNWGEWRGE